MPNFAVGNCTILPSTIFVSWINNINWHEYCNIEYFLKSPCHISSSRAGLPSESSGSKLDSGGLWWHWTDLVTRNSHCIDAWSLSCLQIFSMCFLPQLWNASNVAYFYLSYILGRTYLILIKDSQCGGHLCFHLWFGHAFHCEVGFSVIYCSTVLANVPVYHRGTFTSSDE